MRRGIKTVQESMDLIRRPVSSHCFACFEGSGKFAVRLMFDLGKENHIDYLTWKEHLKISKTESSVDEFI